MKERGFDSPGLRRGPVSTWEMQGRYSKDAHMFSSAERQAVFDRGHTCSNNPETRAGIGASYSHSLFCVFRNRGDEPTGKSVTAKLLGDPAPDRVVPEIHDEVDHRRQPSPIHLTFADMRRAYGEN